MGEELNSNQIKENLMELQRIKTFAQVKKRLEIVNSIGNLTELQKAFKSKFEKLNLRVEELERKNEFLEKVNKEINEGVLSRIKRVEYESKMIKAER